MPHRCAKIFLGISLRPSVLAPHSRLNCLAPIGLGTPFVECVTGYMSRLAASHLVTTGALFEFEVAPVINKPYLSVGTLARGAAGTALKTVLRHAVVRMNGGGVAAADCVTALQSLTLCRDLRFLTLLPWSAILTERNLLRGIRAWCPECYEQWRGEGRPVYEPLLWALDVVQICSRHRRPLVNRCPDCGKQLPLLARRSRPGYCPRCDGWLGEETGSARAEAEQTPREELEWQTWVCDNVGGLLAAAPALQLPPARENLTRAVRAGIDGTKDGTLTRFAALLGKRKSTVWGWQWGENCPTLHDLLLLSYGVGSTLLDFLTDPAPLPPTTLPLESLGGKFPFTPKKPIRKKPFSHAAVEKKLRNFLQAEVAVSVQEAARRMGYAVRTLYRCFPALCKQISRRHSEYKKASTNQTTQRMYQELRQAVIRLRAAQSKPTDRNVALFLNKPEYIYRRDVSAALREIRSRLEGSQAEQISSRHIAENEYVPCA